MSDPKRRILTLAVASLLVASSVVPLVGLLIAEIVPRTFSTSTWRERPWTRTSMEDLPNDSSAVALAMLGTPDVSLESTSQFFLSVKDRYPTRQRANRVYIWGAAMPMGLYTTNWQAVVYRWDDEGEEFRGVNGEFYAPFPWEGWVLYALSALGVIIGAWLMIGTAITSFRQGLRNERIGASVVLVLFVAALAVEFLARV